MSGTSCSRKYAKHYTEAKQESNKAGLIVFAVILAVVGVVGYLALFAH